MLHFLIVFLGGGAGRILLSAERRGHIFRRSDVVGSWVSNVGGVMKGEICLLGGAFALS